jgi:predicted ATPase
LVTLYPGGVGKLSIKIGEQVISNYPDGVWLVELGPINDPALVSRTTAITLGLRDDSQRTVIDVLSRYLREKQMLIVLDNCEHLLDECARFTFMLLSHCPRLHILTTSRELLGVTGEAIYRIPSLAIPDTQLLPNSFKEYESLELFEERAQLIQFGFSIKMENAIFITHICNRLDGIPLAIELAAAKVGTLSIEQIAEQLDGNFNLLVGGSRTALPRQQTLHASISWSWSLLTKSEQIIMRQLSIFAGGWTLEAAQSICDGDVLYLLNSLVSKSLIVMYLGYGIEGRYCFHESIRQYASEKLVMQTKNRISVIAISNIFSTSRNRLSKNL